MKEHTYNLKHPFQYAFKGENPEASFISMTAPTYKQLDKISPIKQAFMAAVTEIQGDTDVAATELEDQGDKVITGPQVMQLMYRWKGNMAAVHLHAAELFKSGAALIDGETKITQPLLDKMQFDDFEGMVGDYIANFIAPSLMDGQ